jgi:hypothetical protein
MIWNFLFHSMWGAIGGTALIVVACVAVGYFFPPLRRIAIEVAGVALAAATIYTKGNRDEAAKWNQAVQKDLQKGQDARAAAQRDVDAGRVRGDEWNRDKS